MKAGDGRRVVRATPLRRYRELVCLACAVTLWLVVWALEREGFAGHRGHAALLVLGGIEATTLSVLFLLEQGTAREAHTPWITVAWASLPLWCALQLLLGSVLSTNR
jgi:hypothetical protein